MQNNKSEKKIPQGIFYLLKFSSRKKYVFNRGFKEGRDYGLKAYSLDHPSAEFLVTAGIMLACFEREEIDDVFFHVPSKSVAAFKNRTVVWSNAEYRQKKYKERKTDAKIQEQRKN